MNSEEELQKEIKELKARLSVIEKYIFKKQEPVSTEDDDDDERDQCWGCGEYVDTGVVHKCYGR